MKLLLFILFISQVLLSYAQNDTITNRYNFLKNCISILANDSMKGRAVGSLEEEKSVEFIQKTFYRLNYKKLKVQKFSFTIDSIQFNSQNAYAFVNNQKKETLIFGAHYDHIGYGGKLSKSATTNQIHNGADDNASGVALLLALSEKLINQTNPKYNYLFVFYSAHEIGLFGSSAFAEKFLKKEKQIKSIKLAINFDMVGRMDSDLRKIKCYSSKESILEVYSDFQLKNGFQLNYFVDLTKLTNLDTHIFIEKGIPCLNFTTGIHIDYHTVSDDEKYINYKGIILLENYLIQLIKNYF